MLRHITVNVLGGFGRCGASGVGTRDTFAHCLVAAYQRHYQATDTRFVGIMFTRRRQCMVIVTRIVERRWSALLRYHIGSE